MIKTLIFSLSLIFFLIVNNFANAATYGCGDTLGDATVPDGATCNCGGAQWEGYSNGTYLFGSVTDRNICCGWVQSGSAWSGWKDQCLSADPAIGNVALCGETYLSSLFGGSDKTCICGGGGGSIEMSGGRICCGWLRDGNCQSTDVGISDLEASEQTLNSLNPLAVGGSTADMSTPGAIISRALGSFIFPIAGIILFVQLLLGGFQMLTGAAAKGMDEGKQKITSALIGFIILFAAYWIAQLLELIFGIRILS